MLRDPLQPDSPGITESPPGIPESPTGPGGEPPQGSKRRRRIAIIVAAVVLVLAFLVVRGLHRNAPTGERTAGQFGQAFSGQEAPIAVSVARATTGDIAVRI